MFSLNPFNSLALVIAIVAYVGAVRLAIQQRLGQEKRKLKRLRKRQAARDQAELKITAAKTALTAATEKSAAAAGEIAAAETALAAAKKAIQAAPKDLVRLFFHTRGHAWAILLLMPADIIFISVAIILIFTGIPGSRARAIDWGIMAGAFWLAFLHFLQWREGYKATKPYEETNGDEPEAPGKELNRKELNRKELAKKGPLVHLGWYLTAIIVPFVLMLGLLFWPSSDTDQTENAEAHHKSGLELYELDRFDEAIAEQRHAVRIGDKTARDKMARYHYALAKALAKALASKSDEYAPLAALRLAIDNDCELREEAKREAAFESIRSDAPLHELVGGPSADGNR